MDLPATAEPWLISEEEYVHLIAVGFNDARWFPATEFTNLSPSCLDLRRKTCITGQKHTCLSASVCLFQPRPSLPECLWWWMGLVVWPTVADAFTDRSEQQADLPQLCFSLIWGSEPSTPRLNQREIKLEGWGFFSSLTAGYDPEPLSSGQW